MGANRPEGSLSLEQALELVPRFEATEKVALSGAVARDPEAFLDMARRLFERVEAAGWSFDVAAPDRGGASDLAAEAWRRLDGPGTHRTADQMARRFREVLLERRDKPVAKAMEERAYALVPERDRLAMLVEILYARGGGLDAHGKVVPPGLAR